MSETKFKLEVRPTIPERLQGLETLANDLYYSWDRNVRGLFYSMDRSLWHDCGHNPKVFLRRISQSTLNKAAEDNLFIRSIPASSLPMRATSKKPAVHKSVSILNRDTT